MHPAIAAILADLPAQPPFGAANPDFGYLIYVVDDPFIQSCYAALDLGGPKCVSASRWMLWGAGASLQEAIDHFNRGLEADVALTVDELPEMADVAVGEEVSRTTHWRRATHTLVSAVRDRGYIPFVVRPDGVADLA